MLFQTALKLYNMYHSNILHHNRCGQCIINLISVQDIYHSHNYWTDNHYWNCNFLQVIFCWLQLLQYNKQVFYKEHYPINIHNPHHMVVIHEPYLDILKHSHIHLLNWQFHKEIFFHRISCFIVTTQTVKSKTIVIYFSAFFLINLRLSIDI